MQLPDGYKQFETTALIAARSSCNEAHFCRLSALAVSLYGECPELGENIAQLMTSIWVQHSQGWDDGRAESLGQLFADLDVPPHHVAGGEIGARRKWQKLERITGQMPEANSQAA